MASVFVIVSKKEFEKACTAAAPGALFSTDTYASTHKALDVLGAGDALFLATVRPPDEKLWLVGVLERPKKGAKGFTAPAANVVPITDITSLRKQIRFATGTGIADKPGALAMSLQTPRALTDDDVRLLRAAAGGTTPTPKSAPQPDAVIVYSSEAKKYLLARVPADLEEDGDAARKRRVAAAKYFAEHGGIAKSIDEMLESASVLEVPPETIAEMLLLEDDSTRRLCREIGERHWASTPPAKRGRILACFPDRADWAAELARELLADKKANVSRDLLLSTLADAELLLEVAKANGLAACIVNVVLRMREKAVPVLAAFLEQAKYPNEEKAVARSLACIGTAEAASAFVEHLRKKNVRPYATEFFARFPHLAPEALGPIAKKKTQVGEVARTILQSLERAAEKPNEDAVESVSSVDVPEILREPPWSRKKKPSRKPITIPDLPVPRDPVRFHWSERARRRWIAERFQTTGTYRSDEDTQRLRDSIAQGKGYLYGNYPPDVAIPILARASDASIYVFNEAPNQMLALHGTAVVEAVVDHHVGRLEGEPLLRVESPRVAAELASGGLRHATSRRREALTWIARYPESAARGLVPVAVGAEPKSRRGAEFGLRELARLGHRGLIDEVAATLGEGVPAAVDEILAWDESLELKKPPKMPPIYRPEELRAPKLKSGLALPREAMIVLDQLLATLDADTHPPWLDAICDACDARSLAEHAWDLAKAWDINGAKESARWMLHAVAHLGDDEVVRRLTPALKGEGIAPMLGDIGTNAALMELITIHVRITKSKSNPKYAWGTEAAIAQIAMRRGLESDEIEDRFVPTCDLDAKGGVALDLGPRSYRLTFDPQLRPILLDETGTRVKTLPRGAKEDDPKKVEAAATLLADLTEDVGAIAEWRAASLERAMLDGRTWSTESFRTIWVEHALMKHMATGVVWEARTANGERLATFRVAEDGTFADEDDDHHPLPEGTTHVGVAHPLRWPKESREKWRKLFADYELLQPFDQLARDDAHAITGETTRKLSLERDEASARLVRAGFITSSRMHILPLEGDVDLVVSITNADVTLAAVRDRRYVDVATLDVIARSELGRALALLSA